MRYSMGFKASIVRKSQDGSGRSIDELARESGIHSATIGRWIQQYRAGTLSLDGSDAIQPSHCHPGEKLSLLLEAGQSVPTEWVTGSGVMGFTPNTSRCGNRSWSPWRA